MASTKLSARIPEKVRSPTRRQTSAQAATTAQWKIHRTLRHSIPIPTHERPSINNTAKMVVMYEIAGRKIGSHYVRLHHHHHPTLAPLYTMRQAQNKSGAP